MLSTQLQLDANTLNQNLWETLALKHDENISQSQYTTHLSNIFVISTVNLVHTKFMNTI